MKITVLVLAFPFLLFGCHTKDTAPRPTEESGCFPKPAQEKTENPVTENYTEFTLAENQAKVLYEPGLQLKVVSIEESRCPSNVICIYMGSASVTIEVNQQQQLNLCLGHCDNTATPQHTKTFTSGSDRYTLQLIDVDPYPMSGQAQPAKTAKLKLTKM